MAVPIADAPAAPGQTHHHGTTFREVKLVSDQPGVARLTDPDLVNPWGMSRGPNTPVWVSDNGTDKSTLYQTNVPGQRVTKADLVVDIPNGAPTGQVFNDTRDFGIADPMKMSSAPATFIFAGEGGDIWAWNGAQGTTAVRVAHRHRSVYKGLALVHSRYGPRLLATNFGRNRIDVYDGDFNRVRTHGRFEDPFLPRHYAPFNAASINGLVYVSYARQDAAHEDDVAGPGHGFIDVYTPGGRFVDRFASRGVLNSPWGMTIAPRSFGRFAGDLLVGNFGDGRIHAFDPRTGDLQGVLRAPSGRPVHIEGLWGLLVGDQVAGGPRNLWFSAGPDDESHGLLGLLKPQFRRHR
jgi:uncharacterized protein (TIGR03118 family)